MGEVSTQVSQRELAIGVLLEIAQDTDATTEERVNAACSVIDATAPVYHVAQEDQDEALRKVGDQVAERVLERIEFNALAATGVTG
jgi:hypothetical protein